ncbi:hypothetical protein BOX15_Mlig011995g1 [Macrostomum lignano]|uniref:Uncharacterized protein n=1 Tax=Macrostomum lignano TaxID=282301 RepID=A0A267DZD1_9PLAT|nr:hypothetical protein BOX15_Mlig011995g1 [Macrostomum lignano]
MLAQHLWPIAALVLAGALLGRANSQSNETISCYRGWGTDVTRDFPKGMKICPNATVCFELQSKKNWKQRIGFYQLLVRCGHCPEWYIRDPSVFDCRECTTNLCNDKFAKELVPELPNLITCYATQNFEDGEVIHPVAMQCPRKHGCSTGLIYDTFQAILVGCGEDCEQFGWESCRRCHTDLCNNRGDYWEYGDPDARPYTFIKGSKLLSDEAVSVSSSVTRPTALVSVLSLATAPALRLVWHQQLLMP